MLEKDFWIVAFVKPSIQTFGKPHRCVKPRGIKLWKHHYVQSWCTYTFNNRRDKCIRGGWGRALGATWSISQNHKGIEIKEGTKTRIDFVLRGFRRLALSVHGHIHQSHMGSENMNLKYMEIQYCNPVDWLRTLFLHHFDFSYYSLLVRWCFKNRKAVSSCFYRRKVRCPLHISRRQWSN